MMGQSKSYMDLIGDSYHPINSNKNDTKLTQLTRGSLWNAKVEINIDGVTNIRVIPRRAE